MSENRETTSVETVDMNLDDILNIGDSVMLPAGDKKEEVNVLLVPLKL